MTKVLWWSDGDEDEDGVLLGPFFDLGMAFGEMARVAGREEDADFFNLYYVPHSGDSTMPGDYIELVRDQAKLFLDRHRTRLTDHAVWILEQLSLMPGFKPSSSSRVARCSTAGRSRS